MTNGQQGRLPTKLWTLCRRTIEDSIQRYSTGPGFKGYHKSLFSEGELRGTFSGKSAWKPRPTGRHSAMTTYVYETIPQTAGEVPVRFDYQQGMNDPKLTEQPGTGKPVRRLISGGFTLLREEQLSAGSVTDSAWHCKD